MTPRARQAGTEDGFTLVELLVSLALMAMMSAYALGALRSFGAIERVSRQFEAQAEVDAVQRNLRQLIGDARWILRTGDDGVPQAIFSGEPERLVLLSVLNDRLERGGLYVLEFTHDAANRHLEMRRRLYRPSGDGSERRLVLLEGVERIALRYCGTPCTADPSRWPESWEAADRLPSRVALDIAFTTPGRGWPLLRVPVMVAQ